jgi:hypothetical protein
VSFNTSSISHKLYNLTHIAIFHPW